MKQSDTAKERHIKKKIKEFNNLIAKKRIIELEMMQKAKERQKEMMEEGSKAKDAVLEKVERIQMSASKRQKLQTCEKEWKTKLLSIRSGDMEENMRHIQRAVSLKHNMLLSRQKESSLKIDKRKDKMDKYVQEKL